MAKFLAERKGESVQRIPAVVLGIAATLALISPVGAQVTPTLRVEGSVGGYLAGDIPARLVFDATCDRLRDATARLDGETTLRLDLSGPVPRAHGAVPPALEPLVRDGIALMAAVQTIAPGLQGRTYVARLAPTRVFIGTDGVGGRTFDDPCDGLGHLLGLLMAGAGVPMPGGTADGRTMLGAIDAAGGLRAVAAAAQVVPMAGTAVLRIADLPGDVAAVSGPPGLTVSGLTRGSDGELRATVRTDGTVAPGTHVLLAFGPESRIRPRARWAITVVPGGEAGGAVAPASGLPLTIGQVARGTIAGAPAVYLLQVPTAQRLTLETAGPSDTLITLRAADGAIIARDDDGAGGYNARVEATLRPGTYRVEVGHATGGGGDFLIGAAVGGARPFSGP